MKKLTLKHTRFNLPIELRFLGIPTRWVPRDDEQGIRYLVPCVSQNLGRKRERIADPEDVRKRFFKMGNDEESALEFLNSVGVFSAEESDHISVWPDGKLRKGEVIVGDKESYLTGSFGHRFIQDGRAHPWELESLCRKRDKWRDLMRSSSMKLRKMFGPFSGSSVEEAWSFAAESRFRNTLPIHLEWQGRHPLAVIQPITVEELLKALTWIDLTTGATVRVCANVNCGIEYTRGGSKFCTRLCEHATAVRTWRINRKGKEKEAAPA